MPKTFLALVWRVSAADQVWLTLLSIAVSLVGTVPIEIQRRIVNDAIKQQDLHAVAMLALIYVGLVIVEGLLKLTMNTYRSWVGSSTTRLLRTSIDALAHSRDRELDVATSQGVKISMIVAEVDVIGGFVGECIAEPALEASILVVMLGYMFILQPILALVSAAILAVQFAFVPFMQREISRKVQARIAKLRQASANAIMVEPELDRPQMPNDGIFHHVFRLDMGVAILKFTLNFLMNLTTQLGRIAILGLGAWLVVLGQTQVGTIVAFLSGLANINDPWGDIVSWFQNMMVTGARYRLVRDAVFDLYEAPEPAALASTGG